MVPRDSEIVLSHNDTAEGNILASLTDSTKLTLIDYEYGGWNPIAMDIAHYLNECCIDDAHPMDVGVKLYLENFPSENERHELIKYYIRNYYERLAITDSTKDDYDHFEAVMLAKLDQEVK